MVYNTLIRPAIPAMLGVQAITNLTANYIASHTTSPVFTQPIYSDPYRQALNNSRAYFLYSYKKKLLYKRFFNKRKNKQSSVNLGR